MGQKCKLTYIDNTNISQEFSKYFYIIFMKI